MISLSVYCFLADAPARQMFLINPTKKIVVLYTPTGLFSPLVYETIGLAHVHSLVILECHLVVSETSHLKQNHSVCLYAESWASATEINGPP